VAARLTNKCVFKRRAATQCRPYSCYIVVQFHFETFEAKQIGINEAECVYELPEVHQVLW
jgi:hypothetical protein